MKLVKLFANDNFKNIEFSSDFNVIIATIFDKAKEKDTHNLGKTSLIRVIDFLLLAKYSGEIKKLFDRPLFAHQEFYGEFLMNDGKYLVIRRCIDKPTKISFKLSINALEGFIAPEHWDEEDLPFERSREFLDKTLGFDVIQDFPYRKSITYYLRAQKDYLDVFSLDKFKGKHKDWKPFVFSLLGFNGSLVLKKFELEEEVAKYKNSIDTLREEAQVNPEERDKLLGLIDIKTAEVEKTDVTLSGFNFYDSDKKLNEELVESIDSRIQELNTSRYSLSYEIDKIQASLKSSHEEVTMHELESLFEETKIYFGNQIKKDFSELLEFNSQVSAERTEFLQESLNEQLLLLKDIENELVQLEEKKSSILSFLTQEDSYKKFKEYQRKLAKTEAELNLLREKLSIIDKSVGYQEKITATKEKIKTVITEIHNEINTRAHADINKIFNQIISDILYTNAILSLKQNSNGNVEYSADFQNPADLIETAEGQGTTYKKILCMAFDLAILIHYSSKSFFRFIYHDGILEGLDDRKKSNLINIVKNICQQNGLQYIMTLIDSDIPLVEGKKIEFSKQEICLELNDKDKYGTLFHANF